MAMATSGSAPWGTTPDGLNLGRDAPPDVADGHIGCSAAVSAT
jgi:hypothetical protein